MTVNLKIKSKDFDLIASGAKKMNGEIYLNITEISYWLKIQLVNKMVIQKSNMLYLKMDILKIAEK